MKQITLIIPDYRRKDIEKDLLSRVVKDVKDFMNTYSEYLNNELSLSFDEMLQIHNEMLAEIGSEETALELYEDLIAQATKYADYRANWSLWSTDRKTEQDASRSKCHNALIDCFNILERYLKTLGKDAIWRTTLGSIEENPRYRMRIGDFACFLVFINSINSR